MKQAFTMIELIFVIVIIGILSAVAIPKLTGIFGQAKGSKILAYAGTLQRTTIPPYWSQSIMGGSNGEINVTGIPSKILADLAYPTDFTSIPDFTSLEISGYDFNDSVAPTKVIATATFNTQTYKLVCSNGSRSIAPACDVYDGSKWILKNNR